MTSDLAVSPAPAPWQHSESSNHHSKGYMWMLRFAGEPDPNGVDTSADAVGWREWAASQALMEHIFHLAL